MTEKLLQYLWQFQYFNRTQLITGGGEAIQIIFQGKKNTNQGPDFTDAKIRIGNTLFAGSVELHNQASEWQKHGHQNDPNYRNVILHVVFRNDLDIGNNIPVLELEPHIPKMMLEKYDGLMQSNGFISCAPNIAAVKEITWHSWKERLLAERLSRKSNAILGMLQQSRFHWEEMFWWLLARTFGGKVNAEAFEAIARSISLNILARHKNSIHQLEALLLGQANLLEKEFEEDYPKLLQREYRFLKVKYTLQPISIPIHFLRMRPQNFPTVRLAQLAMLLHQSSHLFSKVLETTDVKEIKSWLNCTANDFWHYHYTLHELSVYQPKNLGTSTIENIMINTIVPVLFAYGLYHNEEKYKIKALHWLEAISAEDNSILDGFRQLSIPIQTAYDSQSLLELKNEYCNNKRCLECSVGNALLRV